MGLYDREGILDVEMPMSVAYGRYCYGGAYTWHYGHFLLEGLSRLPIDIEQRKCSVFLYHDITNGMCSPHIKFFLNSLGLTAFPVAVPTRVVGSIEITSPRVRLHSYFRQEQSVIYQQIKKYVEAIYDASDRPLLRYVYLSRSKIEKGKRKLANESALEMCLIHCGVDIIHMQELPIETQIMIVSRADLIIGPIGSAMHNTVFCKPETRIIYLCENINDNFPMCDAMMRHEAMYCLSKISADGSWSVDIPKIDALDTLRSTSCFSFGNVSLIIPTA
jgi:capsular polysaccharide biosynthesis protein